MLSPVDILVTSGTSVTVVIPPIDLFNGKFFWMFLNLSDQAEDKLQTATNIEPVSVQNGATGTVYPLNDILGNVFYSGKLKNRHLYKIAFGTDGAPGKVLHFQCLTVEECAKGYNAGAGSTPPETPPATTTPPAA